MKHTITAGAVVLGAAAATLVAQRFDNVVRADFFAGYRGDAAALARGMEACERVLAADPKNAPALVWHGGGLLFRSGDLFRRGDISGGLAMRDRALKEMKTAVDLRPDDIAVLIPRAAALSASAPYSPGGDAKKMLRTAVADYETVERLQSAAGAQLGTHARGELLGGLANGYRLLDDREKAATYLRRIASELPGTPYAARATAWLEDLNRVRRTERFCIGCHE